jgi:F5/8 type C domain-containing protein
VTIDERTSTSPAARFRTTAVRNLFARIRRSPSQEERERFGPGQSGYSEYAFGRSALLDAEALSQSNEGVVSAALLYRAAIVLFGRAHELRRASGQESGQPEGCPGAPDSQPTQAGLEALSPERRERVQHVLAVPNGEAALATLEPADLLDVLVALRNVALSVAQPLERAAVHARTRQALRRLRHALPWLIAIFVGSGVLWKTFTRTNLAKHSVVSTTSAESNVRANPRALVDGDRKNLGFHTKKGRGEAASIDLGAIQLIHSIEIYNRFDCCQGRAVPLRVDVSTDGITYETVGRRKESFSFWKVSLTGKPVRFLRLTDEGTNFFHLSEVEVY